MAVLRAENRTLLEQLRDTQNLLAIQVRLSILNPCHKSKRIEMRDLALNFSLLKEPLLRADRQMLWQAAGQPNALSDNAPRRMAAMSKAVSEAQTALAQERTLATEAARCALQPYAWPATENRAPFILHPCTWMVISVPRMRRMTRTSTLGDYSQGTIVVHVDHVDHGEPDDLLYKEAPGLHRHSDRNEKREVVHSKGASAGGRASARRVAEAERRAEALAEESASLLLQLNARPTVKAFGALKRQLESLERQLARSHASSDAGQPGTATLGASPALAACLDATSPRLSASVCFLKK